MANNSDPLAALAELRRREEELMRMNEEIDQKNQRVFKDVLNHHTKITDSALEGVPDDDVDFKDFDDEDEQAGLKYDYSQVNPYDRSTLKNSQVPPRNQQGKQYNPYTEHLRQLEDNDDLADSLQIDTRKGDKSESLQAQIASLSKKDAAAKLADMASLQQTVADLNSKVSSLHLENEDLRKMLSAAVSDVKQRDEELAKLREKCRIVAEDCNKLQKDLRAAEDKNEQLKSANMDIKRTLGGLERQKQGAEKETTMMSKTQKKIEVELSKKDQK